MQVGDNKRDASDYSTETPASNLDGLQKYLAEVLKVKIEAHASFIIPRVSEQSRQGILTKRNDIVVLSRISKRDQIRNSGPRRHKPKQLLVLAYNLPQTHFCLCEYTYSLSLKVVMQATESSFHVVRY